MNLQSVQFTFKHVNQTIVIIFTPAPVNTIRVKYNIVVQNKSTGEIRQTDTRYNPSVESCRKIFNALQ